MPQSNLKKSSSAINVQSESSISKDLKSKDLSSAPSRESSVLPKSSKAQQLVNSSVSRSFLWKSADSQSEVGKSNSSLKLSKSQRNMNDNASVNSKSSILDSKLPKKTQGNIINSQPQSMRENKHSQVELKPRARGNDATQSPSEVRQIRGRKLSASEMGNALKEKVESERSKGVKPAASLSSSFVRAFHLKKYAQGDISVGEGDVGVSGDVLQELDKSQHLVLSEQRGIDEAKDYESDFSPYEVHHSPIHRNSKPKFEYPDNILDVDFDIDDLMDEVSV